MAEVCLKVAHQPGGQTPSFGDLASLYHSQFFCMTLKKRIITLPPFMFFSTLAFPKKHQKRWKKNIKWTILCDTSHLCGSLNPRSSASLSHPTTITTTHTHTHTTHLTLPHITSSVLEDSLCQPRLSYHSRLEYSLLSLCHSLLCSSSSLSLYLNLWLPHTHARAHTRTQQSQQHSPRVKTPADVVFHFSLFFFAQRTSSR